jgi:hypothetical protein
MITNNVITIKTVVCGFTLNIPGSDSNALGLTFGPAKLIATITSVVNKNDNPCLLTHLRAHET